MPNTLKCCCSAPFALQTIPPVALDHTLHNLAPSRRTDCPSFVPQLRFADRMNQVALYQRFPIQPVCAVQENLRAIGRATSPLRRAEQHTHERFSAVRSGLEMITAGCGPASGKSYV